MAVRVTMTVNLVIHFLVVSCLFWSIGASKDITYSIHNVPSSNFETVIVLDHFRYRRASNDNSSNSDGATSVPDVPTTKSPVPTTKAPAATTKAPAATTKAPAATTKAQTTQKPVPRTTRPQTQASTTPDTTIIEGEHKYYTSALMQQRAHLYWDNMENGAQHPSLTDNHRTAVSLDISFTFPFYGHNITKITIATGGFLYTSPFLHQWLTATQYIAPLMGNFDTSVGNSSTIYYKDDGSKLVVEWRDIQLQDQNETGMFRFQAILYRNGSIVFLYKQVPVPITNISTANHPVKIGVSDAFYMDSTIVDPDTQESYRRRTIYEYHRVSVGMQQVRAGTVVFLHPLPTCNTMTDCQSCVISLATKSSFECRWCSSISRCSDGIDWHRQKWMKAGCIDTPNSPDCPAASASSTIGVIVAVVIILVALITGIVVWFVYAYKNPTSASGIWLIEHRPSQMKNQMANMKFWKRNTASGEKYQMEAEA